VRRFLVVVSAALLAPAAAGAETPEARLELDLRESSVTDVVRLLAEAGGLQPVFDPGVSCRLTLKTRALAWHEALDATLRACGLGYEAAGRVVRIAPQERLALESRERRELDAARGRSPSASLELWRLSYARAEALAPLLERLLPEGSRVVADPRTNTLLVETRGAGP